MGNDLISRAEVLMTLEKIFGEYRISWGSECGGFAAAVPEAVKQIPTAHDIDKVVERLKDHAIEFEAFGQCCDYVELSHAIEIVKGGTK